MTNIIEQARKRPELADKSVAYITSYLRSEAALRPESSATRADAQTTLRPEAERAFRTDGAPTTPRSAAQASRHRFLVEQNGVPQARADALCANVDVAGIDRQRADAAAFEASIRADAAAYQEKRFAKSAAQQAKLKMQIASDVQSRSREGYSAGDFRPTTSVHYDVAPPTRTTSASEARARLHSRSKSDG